MTPLSKIQLNSGDLLTLTFYGHESDGFVMGCGKVFLSTRREVVDIDEVRESIIKIRTVINGKLLTLWRRK